MKEYLFLLTLLLVIFYNLFVISSEINLGEVEVIEQYQNIFEKNEQPESHTTIVVITEKDESKNLGELLSSCSEVLIKDTGGEAGISTISIRGSSSKNVLVLIDGSPLNTGGNSSFDLNMIPVSLIERIEIIRGGDASLYGSGAMGGIVNIVTKKTDTNYFKYFFNSIFFRGYQNIAAIGIKEKQYDIFFSYDYKFDLGNYLYLDNNGTDFNTKDDLIKRREHNFVEKISFLFKQSFNLEKNINFGYSINFNSKNNQIAGPLTFENHFKTAFLKTKLLNIATFLELGNLNKYFTANFYINYKYDDYIYTNKTEYGGGKESSSEAINHLKQKTSFQINGIPYNLLFIIGEFSYEVSRNGLQRFELAGILRDEFYILSDKIGIIPTTRFQYNSDLKEPFNFLWNVGLFFKPIEGLKIKINGFEAFRNPDFNEMYYTYGQYVGNSQLIPETSFGGDIGANYIGEYFFVETVLFCSYYKNLITYLLSYGFVYKPINIDEAISFGVETKININYKFVFFELGYTLNYVCSIEKLNRGELNQLPGYPLQTIVGKIEFNLLSYNFGVLFKYEDIILITTNGSKSVPHKFVMDTFFRIDFDIKKHNIKPSIFFNANNLLNLFTYDIRNYPLEGFNMNIGFSVIF